MKKKLSIFMLSVLCAGTFTSCVDLDSDKYFEDRKTLEVVFTSKQQSLEWLAYAYRFLKYENVDVGSKGNGFYNSFDDCMYYGDRDRSYGDSKEDPQASYNSYRMGEYNENWDNAAWGDCYKGIYQASVFIHNIDQNTEMTEKERLDYKGQARLVRAYYYWLLLRKYGPVPIVPDEGIDYSKTYDEMAISRSTYEEVAEHIASEMVQAAKEIQYTKRDQANVGRPTKGACLAARALVYIYAASPLANGQLANGTHPAGVTAKIADLLRNKDGKQLLSTTYDEKKWARAAAACKDVMEMGVYELYHAPFNSTEAAGNPVTIVPPDDHNFSEKNWPDGWKDIDPFASYRAVFNGSVSAMDNPELIFSRVNNMLRDNNSSIESLVLHEMPISCGGWNTHGLTQKMVDAYYMNDGNDVPGKDSELNGGDGSQRVQGWTSSDPESDNYFEKHRPLGANVSMQYADREPRFYASVAYSGSVWECLGHPEPTQRGKQIFYYRGGGDGYINAFSYPRTGIGVKKWYNPSDYVESNHSMDGITPKAETAIRYADILLMYAEALNELDGSYEISSWDGSTTYTISRDLNEIKKGIQPVRIRAGVPDYSSDVYGDKNLLRAKIKRERMIELMGEGKRYFDLRRWMDAPVEETQTIYGLNVFMRSENRDDFMRVVPTFNLQQTFADKLYFYPITHDELKRNKLLSQNPGWTYND